MFRLISNFVQSSRPDSAHAGNPAGDHSYHQPSLEQQYYPTHVMDRGYYVAPVQHRPCRSLKQERRVMRQERRAAKHMYKAERIVERQARRSRCPGHSSRPEVFVTAPPASRPAPYSSTVFPPPPPPQQQQQQPQPQYQYQQQASSSNLAADYYNASPYPVGVAARSEPTQHQEQRPRGNEWGLDGEAPPPSYEEVEKKRKA